MDSDRPFWRARNFLLLLLVPFIVVAVVIGLMKRDEGIYARRDQQMRDRVHVVCQKYHVQDVDGCVADMIAAVGKTDS